MVRDILPEELWVGRSIVDEPLSERIVVGTTPIEVLPQNARRVNWLLSNPSANEVAIGRSRDVTVANGHRIAPNGGAISSIVIEDGSITRQQWFIVASAEGTNVARVAGELSGPALQRRPPEVE